MEGQGGLAGARRPAEMHGIAHLQVGQGAPAQLLDIRGLDKLLARFRDNGVFLGLDPHHRRQGQTLQFIPTHGCRAPLRKLKGPGEAQAGEPSPPRDRSSSQPRPRQVRQAMAAAEGSSPDPRQVGQGRVGPRGAATIPLPPQTVQVRVFTAPVPRQWRQGREGAGCRTRPRPPQTQQVDCQDMIPKGSLP